MKIEFTEPEARTILFFLQKGAVESKPAFLPDQPALNVLSSAMRKIRKKLEDKERDEKEKLVDRAVQLHNNVPDGGGHRHGHHTGRLYGQCGLPGIWHIGGHGEDLEGQLRQKRS